MQVADTPADDANAAGACGAGTSALPRTRLVFKGMHWVACPVYSMRVNTAWQQMSDTRREADEDRLRALQRATRHASPAEPDPGSDPDWEAPQ
jgi:hypothetical protein